MDAYIAYGVVVPQYHIIYLLDVSNPQSPPPKSTTRFLTLQSVFVFPPTSQGESSAKPFL